MDGWDQFQFSANSIGPRLPAADPDKLRVGSIGVDERGGVRIHYGATPHVWEPTSQSTYNPPARERTTIQYSAVQEIGGGCYWRAWVRRHTVTFSADIATNHSEFLHEERHPLDPDVFSDLLLDAEFELASRQWERQGGEGKPLFQLVLEARLERDLDRKAAGGEGG